MHIVNFSSCFELFAALNLAYAGSERFRNIVNEEVLDLYEAQAKVLQGIKSFPIFLAITGAKGDVTLDPFQIIEKFVDKLEKIRAKEEASRVFEESFKSIFLTSALFCIAVIIVGGFEQHFVDQETTWLLIFQCIALVFNLSIFANSFFISKAKKKVKPIFVLSFFIILNSIGILSIRYSPLSHYSIPSFWQFFLYWLTIFVAISPYFFHVLRALIHRRQFKKKFQEFDNDLKEYLPEALFGSAESMRKDLKLDC